METEISIGPCIFPAKSIESYIIVLFPNTPWRLSDWDFSVAIKTSQDIPSVIIYFFSALHFNLQENLQKLKHLVLHKPLF